MKRMILGFVAVLFDAWDINRTFSDYSDWQKFHTLSEPNPLEDFWILILRWIVIAVISMLFFLFGFLGWKNRDKK
ncbi:MAG: hypothetical protein PHV74_12295 [Dehalococcoidia bacterium]|nr:hypothetical protein [Dehalococcoidia bacterium]